MTIEILIAVAGGAIIAAILLLPLRKLRHEFIVPEGYAGLLYHRGKFVQRLEAGRHIRWGRLWTIQAADLRKTSLNVAGQEVLTADNVGLKLSILVNYQVADPVKAAHEAQYWLHDLHHLAQLAARTALGAVPVETLLAQRTSLAPQLLALVQPEAAKFGITVHTVEVKDVMFPAELKRAFAEVLKAKQEGQAALERARGETAALRNLANAARILEGNPALMNLRLMQSLSAAQGAGNTLVLGMPGGFVPLKNGHGTPPSSPTESGEA